MEEGSNTKKVSITLIGSNGKMGRAIASLIEQDPDLHLCEDGDLVIDFSAPLGTKKAIAMGKPLVCGTTGLSSEIFTAMEDLSKRVPVLYSPNFSLGISLLFEMLESYKKKLKRYADLSISETHHTQKKDSPSGTALKLGEILQTDAIVAHRVGSVCGIHEVKVCFEDETLTFGHEALSRNAFAKGALVAAKYIYHRPAKMYRLCEIFD